MKDEVKNRIIELADANGGFILPDQVIEDAKDPQSPLHTQFNWDIEQAAFEHWRDTARQLIRSVRIERILHERTIETVAYVRDPRKAAHDQGYISTAILADETDQAREALLYEFGRAEGSLNRAFEVAAALDLEQDVSGLLAGIGLARAKAKKNTA